MSSSPESKWIHIEEVGNDSLNTITLGILMIIFITTSDYYPDLYQSDLIAFLSNHTPWFPTTKNHWFLSRLTNSHVFFFIAITFTVTATLEPGSAWWKYIVYTLIIYVLFFLITSMNYIAVLVCLCLLIIEKFLYKMIKGDQENKPMVWIHRVIFWGIIPLCIILGLVQRKKYLVPEASSSQSLAKRVQRLETLIQNPIATTTTTALGDS